MVGKIADFGQIGWGFWEAGRTPLPNFSGSTPLAVNQHNILSGQKINTLLVVSSSTLWTGSQRGWNNLASEACWWALVLFAEFFLSRSSACATFFPTYAINLFTANNSSWTKVNIMRSGLIRYERHLGLCGRLPGMELVVCLKNLVHLNLWLNYN